MMSETWILGDIIQTCHKRSLCCFYGSHRCGVLMTLVEGCEEYIYNDVTISTKRGDGPDLD